MTPEEMWKRAKLRAVNGFTMNEEDIAGMGYVQGELTRLRAEVERLKKICDDLSGDNFITALAYANYRLALAEKVAEAADKVATHCWGSHEYNDAMDELCTALLAYDAARGRRGG